MKISEFVEKALFDEDNGYYKTKNPIGGSSDFITSPEVSQVFGELLAAYILHAISGYKGEISFVEMGAGRGVLFYDILYTFQKLAKKDNEIDLLLKNINFNIIEINPVLRKVQKEKLDAFGVNFYENFDKFEKENSDRKIIFISNELFDCFAVDQYILSEGGWRERVIVNDGKNRCFSLAPFNKKINEFVKTQIGNVWVPLGGVYEYSKSAREFMQKLCNILKCRGGLAINIDYGYNKNLFVNSLQALKNHKKCDVLEDPGNVDITAHVDFEALDKIAFNYGLNRSFVSQKEFLLALGIENRRKILLEKNQEKEKEINLAVDRLIKSDEMGDLFKVHILWK